MHDKHIRILAVVATIAAICMYTSYIFQIQENLTGNKASPIQPLCAAINCTLWVIYGLFKTPRDLPVAIANAPSALFSASLPASPVSKSVQGSLIYIHIERSGVCKWGVGLGPTTA